MPIDYAAFTETLFARGKISAKKHAEYLKDEDAVPNDISDGKTVLSLGWDGNAPGCSGAIWVRQWKGFYFCTSSDYDDEGPFETLDEVLAMDWFQIATANPELDSDVLPLRTLRQIGLGLVSENGDEIFINDSRYVLKFDKLVKSKPDD